MLQESLQCHNIYFRLSSMTLLDQNGNADVISYADVQLFRSYVSAALDYDFCITNECDADWCLLRADPTQIIALAHWSQ